MSERERDNPATAGIRRPQHGGYGNAEPHAEPRVWTLAEFAEFNTRNNRARAAYYTEPFAGTRDLNQNDQAAARMRASRAEKRKS